MTVVDVEVMKVVGALYGIPAPVEDGATAVTVL
jgi:hypothetical protein